MAETIKHAGFTKDQVARIAQVLRERGVMGKK